MRWAALKPMLLTVAATLLIAQLISCGRDEVLPLGAERPADDEALIALEMIEAIKAVSLARHPDGTIKRFNQAKSLACLGADFHVPDDLPERLRQGLFAQPGHYQAVVRFANASKSDDRDKDFRGMSVKVLGVGGTALWGEDGTQDFLLNSHPALFAGTPAEFLDFIRATQDDALWKFFIKPGNWDSLWVVVRGREKIASPLDIPYWSTTPYRFGTDPAVAVKYSARPCSAVQSQMPDEPEDNYLSQAVAEHLAKAPACFDFMVQFQQDPEAMPVEDASVVWDEAASPFQTVARITMQDQTFLTDQALTACERQTFHPWQSLPTHQPLGGINRVRKAVYAELGAFRSAHNQSP